MLTMLRNAWAQAVATVLGVWLMASPAVLGYAGTASTVHRIVGPVAASLAFVAIWEHMRALRWTTLAFGAPLVAVPWLFGFGLAATANSVLVGALLSFLAFVPGKIEESYGGGWSSLVIGKVRTKSRYEE